MPDTDRMPYYPWYVLDWRADFKVQRLSWKARGLYREILDECWARGHVPDDMNQLADICRCDIKDIAEHWRHIKPLLREVAGSGGALLESARMERERAQILETSRLRSEAGRKGGKSRSGNDSQAGLSRAKLSDQNRSDQTKADQPAEPGSASGLGALGAQPLADLLKAEFERGKEGERL